MYNKFERVQMDMIFACVVYYMALPRGTDGNHDKPH
jgi:hypothetical protein